MIDELKFLIKETKNNQKLQEVFVKISDLPEKSQTDTVELIETLIVCLGGKFRLYGTVERICDNCENVGDLFCYEDVVSKKQYKRCRECVGKDLDISLINNVINWD